VCVSGYAVFPPTRKPTRTHTHPLTPTHTHTTRTLTPTHTHTTRTLTPTHTYTTRTLTPTHNPPVGGGSSRVTFSPCDGISVRNISISIILVTVFVSFRKDPPKGLLESHHFCCAISLKANLEFLIKIRKRVLVRVGLP